MTLGLPFNLKDDVIIRPSDLSGDQHRVVRAHGVALFGPPEAAGELQRLFRPAACRGDWESGSRVLLRAAGAIADLDFEGVGVH